MAEADFRKKQLERSAEEKEESRASKGRAKLDEALASDPRIRMLARRLNDPANPIEIGSPEYDTVMDEVEKIRNKIIKEHPEFSIPDASGEPLYAKDKITGDVIVSYDNFKTHQPVKRPITGGR